MSTRERWTIYPLIFLTLGIALKDKLTQEVIAKRAVAREIVADTMVCKALVVTDKLGNAQVIVESNSGGGLVKTIGVDAPQVWLGHTDRVTGVLFGDGRGNLLPGSILMQRPLPRIETPQPEPSKPDETAPAETAPAEDARPVAPREATEPETREL